MAGTVVKAVALHQGLDRDTVQRRWNRPLEKSDFLAILEALVPSLDEEREGSEGSEDSEADVVFAEEALAICFAGLYSAVEVEDENDEEDEAEEEEEEEGTGATRRHLRCGIAELIAGLTILCSGDKSEKLSVAFDAFDVDRKGALNRHQSICYFRSFVSVLLSLTEGVRHHTTTTTTNNNTTTTTTTDHHHGGDVALSAQVTAVQVTEMLWDRLHLDSAQGVLPFDDFAEWYTEEGYVKSIFIVHVGGTRYVTSRTDNIMKIHARITLKVEFIRGYIFIFLLYV
jgi:hypothetical protein